jgi:hypothetical protein
LDALQKRVLDSVVPAFDNSLAALDDYLFDRSQTGEEALGLTALREMRRVRTELTKSFRQLVAGRFRALRQQGLPADAQAAASGLSLLSDDDLEQQLAVDQLASSALRHAMPAFELATQRLAVVTGQAQVEASANPFSPACLAMALGAAMAQHNIDAELRIVAFKFFERELAGVLDELYERCNGLMISAGILPELRSTAKPQHGAAKTAGKRPLPPSETPPQHYEDERVPMRPQPAPGPAAWDTGPMQVSAADQALFASMLGQLQHWRTANNVAPQQNTTNPASALSTRDLLSVLTLMQRDADAAPTVAPLGSQQSFAGQLRQQMSQSARKLGVTGDNLTLDGLDGDAVDLVALLFDVLLDGPQFDSRIRQMIGRMLVPFVKVAVKDRRMFMFKEHPARRLLNTVAEACEGNRGEAPQEQELLDHVDHTIDRLVAEFNEDVAIFEALEQDLRMYMAQHRKRFELAEKRTTEAHRGRERLEQARSEVTVDLEYHRNGRELPAVIDEFLSTHTQHHLTQIVLRDGRESPRYREALQGVDALLIAVDSALQGRAMPLPEAELLAVLASAGCVGEDGQAALEALADVIARLSIGQMVKPSDERIPAPIVMAEPPPPPTPQLEVVGGADAVDCDDSLLSRISRLEVGHWLQLQGGDGQFAPAKVSWVSPISARLLLVNKRGIRVLVASVRELAVMAALGKVKLRDADAAFDDAMHQVADRLQNLKQA